MDHTHGQTERHRVYVNSGKDVPIHILERVRRIERSLASRGFNTPVRFFVSDFEKRKPIPRERADALNDPWLMILAAVAAPAALVPLVIGQWNEPCLVDPIGRARYARVGDRGVGVSPIRTTPVTRGPPPGATRRAAPPPRPSSGWRRPPPRWRPQSSPRGCRWCSPCSRPPHRPDGAHAAACPV